MKNKGFSLVELIIVIAIMAILAAAIAPALIRYIDKSRRSDDVAAAETLNTAMQAALSNEAIYDEVQSAMGSLSTPDATVPFVSADEDTAFSSTAYQKLAAELNSSAGGKTPKLKFTKDGAKGWIVGANGAGKPVVWLYNNGSWTGHTNQNNDTSATVGGKTAIMLQPSIDAAYK